MIYFLAKCYVFVLRTIDQVLTEHLLCRSRTRSVNSRTKCSCDFVSRATLTSV
jgi:hypothetical protein